MLERKKEPNCRSKQTRRISRFFTRGCDSAPPNDGRLLASSQRRNSYTVVVLAIGLDLAGVELRRASFPIIRSEASAYAAASEGTSIICSCATVLRERRSCERADATISANGMRPILATEKRTIASGRCSKLQNALETLSPKSVTFDRFLHRDTRSN